MELQCEIQRNKDPVMQQYKSIEFDFTMDICLIKIVFLPVQTTELNNVALITESTNLANKTQIVMESDESVELFFC